MGIHKQPVEIDVDPTEFIELDYVDAFILGIEFATFAEYIKHGEPFGMPVREANTARLMKLGREYGRRMTMRPIDVGWYLVTCDPEEVEGEGDILASVG